MNAPAHAYLPPSGAAAWVHCAAWPSMNARYPQDDKPESQEGTAAHWVFSEMLYGRQVAEGQIAPNGIAITDEMLDGAEAFVDLIDRDLAACGLDRRYLQVERRIYIPSVHAENWGTPDVWFYDQANGKIYIYDYKFGHKFVDAYENWQCIDYAAGIFDTIGVTGAHDHYITVEIVVAQPRNYDRGGPVRRWQVKAVDLRGHINILGNAAGAALQVNPTATVGDHCEYCPGRHACNTLQRAAYVAVHKSKDSTPVDLPGAALGLELRILERAAADLKARISGLQQEAEVRMLKKGERIPGLMTVETFGRTTWSKPVPEVLAVAQMLGVDISKPAVLTPTQAKKLIPAELVAAYSHTPRTGVKVVADDGTLARKVFGK